MPATNTIALASGGVIGTLFAWKAMPSQDQRQDQAEALEAERARKDHKGVLTTRESRDYDRRIDELSPFKAATMAKITGGTVLGIGVGGAFFQSAESGEAHGLNALFSTIGGPVDDGSKIKPPKRSAWPGVVARFGAGLVIGAYIGDAIRD